MFYTQTISQQAFIIIALVSVFAFFLARTEKPLITKTKAEEIAEKEVLRLQKSGKLSLGDVYATGESKLTKTVYMQNPIIVQPDKWHIIVALETVPPTAYHLLISPYGAPLGMSRVYENYRVREIQDFTYVYGTPSKEAKAVEGKPAEEAGA